MTATAPEIVQARSAREIADVRALMEAFIAWLMERYRDRPWQLETYYGDDAWKREIAGLPGDYAPPAGRLLLARYGPEPAGCVALKRLDATSCDVKRLYVRPHFRGLGLGKALMRVLMAEARDAGYATMKLDTGILQPEAVALYRALGFRETGPYYEEPEALAGAMVYMERELTAIDQPT